MKHITPLTQTPAKASLPLSAIVSAIASILAVLGEVLGTKDEAGL